MARGKEEPMVRVENLTLRYGNFYLRNISFEIRRGECFVLLGPSGAGKTLLLETILGLKQPETGKIWLEGRDITQIPPEERGIGYVPQDLALFPHLSVKDNILFAAHLRGWPENKVQERLDWLVNLLNLEEVLHRPCVSTLSGGEKQRVALARALLIQPRILFLDEPFASLDAYIRRDLQIQFKDLQKSLGLTLFQVTHDQEEAYLMGDHLAIMIRGEIVQQGVPAEVYRRPASLSVARFLMMQNLYPAQILGKLEASPDLPGSGGKGPLYKCDLGPIQITLQTDLPLRVGQKVFVGIRPEEVLVIRPDRPTRPSLEAWAYEGFLREVVNLGGQQLLRIEVPGPGGLRMDSTVRPRLIDEVGWQANTPVRISLRPSAWCVLVE